MTTVREARIQAAADALDRALIPFGDGISAGHLRIASAAVVDALFTDHTLDNVEVPAPPRLRGH